MRDLGDERRTDDVDVVDSVTDVDDEVVAAATVAVDNVADLETLLLDERGLLADRVGEGSARDAYAAATGAAVSVSSGAGLVALPCDAVRGNDDVTSDD